MNFTVHLLFGPALSKLERPRKQRGESDEVVRNSNSFLYALQLSIQNHRLSEQEKSMAWACKLRFSEYEPQKQEQKAVAEGKEPQHRSNSNGAGLEASAERPAFVGTSVPLQVQAPTQA